ncbi:prolyl oligopeptidase family serine peptidase [Streptomyces sp. PTM05]|uniref:Prolyl oligopeptidase family serine peptidase n=1 Tax=Streptantibioticus parmotrematis TaxID=2873249 RepID=A0ABS7QLS0_9ACTN|nr:alpha/beta fold hydrolase [Streptantibioticus parmotrematis]MBY8884139.1 prolyl oligopeptidase family serine peptidase [Streptantibioticus parmotrematis]
MSDHLSFPRQHARTQRFTLGTPRSLTVAPDGGRVVFLRSASGTDRANRLWVLDVREGGGEGDGGAERLVADPGVLLAGAREELTAEERARRERSREGSAGIVAYAVDGAVRTAAFALSGRLFTADLTADAAGDASGEGAGVRSRVRELPVAAPVIDPRPSPDGRHVAYVSGGALRVVAADGSGDRVVAGPGDGEGHVTWGLAEFVAAEEMDRSRGYWWSPDGDRLLAARVDDSPVRRWWIADPANPRDAPAEVAYPAAGTPNAEVTLALCGLDGSRTEVTWDRERYPYLARAHWSAAGPPLLLVQSRDQRGQAYLTVDVTTGRTTVARTEQDPAWLELSTGVPAWAPDGRMVRIEDRDGARVLVVGDEAVTDARLHVRAVLDVAADGVLFTASAGRDAKDPGVGEVHVHHAGADGVTRLTSAVGTHTAVRGGPSTVVSGTALDRPGAEVRVLRGEALTEVARVASYAERPVLTARPVLTRAGERGIPAAVLLPSGYREGDGPLPVLMDPYGGPHGQRVVASHNAHLTSQWFAEQGFAVVVADGRGTPGTSPEWEKAIAGDFAGVTLDDQVHALRALAASHPLDLERVAIRGWSYGGYLAALAVLRRPDVFHAAVSGAPVTDWRLYDTHYTERYLGDPGSAPEVYAANSLTDPAGWARGGPVRPLMVVHGLADDNVVAAHTLRLSSALLAAGRPHQVLPLSGVTHMTPQEQVAENLLLLQVDFLKQALGATGTGAAR